MSETVKNEKPEVYALRKEEGNWQISRRDFLKAAGIGAAALGAGMNSGCAAKKPLDKVCGKVPSHNHDIYRLLPSPDGKYLLSADNGNLVKCWDFNRQSYLGDCNVTYSDAVGVGMIIERPVLAYSDRHSQILYYDLPILDSPETHALDIPYSHNFAINSDGLVYSVNGNSRIELFRYNDGYKRNEILYENSRQGFTIGKIYLFNHEQQLFISLEGKGTVKSFAVLDLQSGTAKEFDETYSAFAAFPNDSRILIFYENEYRLLSSESGEVLWSAEYVHPNYPKSEFYFYGAAVTADGSEAVLLAGEWVGIMTVQRISMSDGAIQTSYVMKETNRTGTHAGPVFSGDETKCAVSDGKTLLFFSFPDLQLLACPIDINEAKDNTKGIEISQTDGVTGETYTCTLPCGAAIPEGAVCTCNCVTGRGGCACVGHSNSGGSGGGHYWHPN